MQRFTLPRDLYHGKGALEALKSFEGKKAIICVGGGSMKRFGFLDKAEAYLKEAGMEVKLFEGIEPDPSVETVMKGAAAMAEFEPEQLAVARLSMQLRLCGLSTSIRISHSRICARYLVFQSLERRHISVLFHPHQVQQLRLLRSQSSQIMRRVSSIQSQTLRLHLMLQS